MRTGDERFEVLDSRTHLNGDVSINARLVTDSAHLADLAFRLRPAGQSFRFLDISFNGYSLLRAARVWYFDQWQQPPPLPR